MMMKPRTLSSRELAQRLSDLIDRLQDPAYRIYDPEGFATDYHVLVALALQHRDKLDTRYVTHNLGRRRLQVIEELLRGEDGHGTE